MALAKFRKIQGKNPSGRFVVSDGSIICCHYEVPEIENATPNIDWKALNKIINDNPEVFPKVKLEDIGSNLKLIKEPFQSAHEILGCTFSDYKKQVNDKYDALPKKKYD